MGLQIIKPGTRIKFIERRRIGYAVSGIVLILGILSLLFKGGPQYGIDFAGGIIVQVKFDQQVDLGELKGTLNQAEFTDLVVQRFGDEDQNSFLLRLPEGEASPEMVRNEVEQVLSSWQGEEGFSIQRLEMVGPKVGADLRTKALQALFYAVLIIAIYISGRFEQRWFAAGIMAAGLATGIYLLQLLKLPMGYLILAAMIITLGLCWYLRLKYAFGAVAALIHDVLITVGVFSLLNKEFDLTIVAALLTIIGYSLNDTIIVFDRIRENLRGKVRESLGSIINTSINQTLSRTILTSGTTLIVVLALFLFGGGVIHDFAFALLIGVLVGTYSSVFIASPILLGIGPEPEPEETPSEG
ncbi:MAG: protein translocase subunit SecF [Desulfovibrionales bacterium]